MPDQNDGFILTPKKPIISVALEPALNAFNSLTLLAKGSEFPDLNPWVTQTMARLSPEQLHTHQLVFVGLYFAIIPAQSWPSFPAYMDDLAKQDPAFLRDRLFEAYEGFPLSGKPTESAIRPLDIPALLANREAYLNYLRERFTEDKVDVDIEREAHALLNDLPALQKRVVSHLRTMWAEVLAPEWERAAPMLRTSVLAFQPTDYSRLSILDATRYITGQEPKEEWVSASQESDRVIFVPALHFGPYLSKCHCGRTRWVFFGARLPPGANIYAPDLARSELLARLMAVADDTRLHILHLLAEQGELCSPDIMRQLNLSQPAASRHLQQLSAAGYIVERRRETAKCYSLNPERLEDTIQSLGRFLRKARPQPATLV